MNYYSSLQQEVVERFAGKRWTIPSRIYSDSVTIYPGQRLDDIGFFERIARLNYHRVDTPAEVNARGAYYYDEKHGELLIFLHGFPYPFKDFSGELVRSSSWRRTAPSPRSTTASPISRYIRSSWSRNCRAQSSRATGSSAGWCH